MKSIRFIYTKRFNASAAKIKPTLLLDRGCFWQPSRAQPIINPNEPTHGGLYIVRQMRCGSMQSGFCLGVFAIVAMLLAGCQETSRPSHKWMEQMEPADGNSSKQITLAIAAVQKWWSAHKDGFPKCRMLPPGDEWRRLGPKFFSDPKSKGIAFSALNTDRSDYWWAVRENRDLGPWKISAPQEDGYTFEWTVGVNKDNGSADMVEVRIIYPINIFM